MKRVERGVYYGEGGYDGGIGDWVGWELGDVYRDLGSMYGKMGEKGKGVEYIEKGMGLGGE